MYPRLPEPPARQHAEPVSMYGARLFAFVLSDRCTATLTDEQAELARYAGRQAISGPAALTATYDKINDALHLIGATLRARTSPEPVSVPAAKHDDRPNVGPMARLTTTPNTRPPSGHFAEVLTTSPRPADAIQF